MPQRDQTKVCADCKHSKSKGGFTMCSGVIDLITGRKIESTAVTQRGKKGVCGPSGKHFVEKAKTTEKRKERY